MATIEREIGSAEDGEEHRMTSAELLRMLAHAGMSRGLVEWAGKIFFDVPSSSEKTSDDTYELVDDPAGARIGRVMLVSSDERGVDVDAFAAGLERLARDLRAEVRSPQP